MSLSKMSWDEEGAARFKDSRRSSAPDDLDQHSRRKHPPRYGMDENALRVARRKLRHYEEVFGSGLAYRIGKSIIDHYRRRVETIEQHLREKQCPSTKSA